MRPKIIAVGKLKTAWVTSGLQDYWKRLPELEIIEVKDSTKDKEYKKILSLLQPSDRVIMLSEFGKLLTSVEFSAWVTEMGATPLVFLIGGPEGFSDQMRSHVHEVISLSPMTFTHEMARLFLVEQLYRAKAIQNHSQYHK